MPARLRAQNRVGEDQDATAERHSPPALAGWRVAGVWGKETATGEATNRSFIGGRIRPPGAPCKGEQEPRIYPRSERSERNRRATARRRKSISR